MMVLRLLPEEPAAGPWLARPLVEVADQLLSACAGVPAIIAVDGRSASGKSTVAQRLGAQLSAVVVHTDDVAWWESFFGWDDLLVQGVLAPFREGREVAFRPPAWVQRGRAGAIEVPAGTRVLVVEGVGASRMSLMPWVDVAVWVQCDHAEARRRGLVRDGADAEEFWDQWQSEEVPFLAADRPWDRAAMVICGTPDLAGALCGPADLLVAPRAA